MDIGYKARLGLAVLAASLAAGCGRPSLEQMMKEAGQKVDESVQFEIGEKGKGSKFEEYGVKEVLEVRYKFGSQRDYIPFFVVRMAQGKGFDVREFFGTTLEVVLTKQDRGDYLVFLTPPRGKEMNEANLYVNQIINSLK